MSNTANKGSSILLDMSSYKESAICLFVLVTVQTSLKMQFAASLYCELWIGFSDLCLRRSEAGGPANSMPARKARGKPLVSPWACPSPHPADRPRQDPWCSPAEMPSQGEFRLWFFYFLVVNYQDKRSLNTHKHTRIIMEVKAPSTGIPLTWKKC